MDCNKKAILKILNEEALPVRQNERDVSMVVVDERGGDELMRKEQGKRREKRGKLRREELDQTD